MEQLRPATPRGLEQAQRRNTSFEALQVGLHIAVGLSVVQALNGIVHCGAYTTIPLTVSFACTPPSHSYSSFAFNLIHLSVQAPAS